MGLERKFGGKFHLRLSTAPSTIVYKYHEGKVKSTLERELNVPEIGVEQAFEISVQFEMCSRFSVVDLLRLPQRFGLRGYLGSQVSEAALARVCGVRTNP